MDKNYDTNQRHVEDTLSRKEFRQFYNTQSEENYAINDSFIDEMLRKKGHIFLQSHQLFTRNYINPNTPYTRLLIKDVPGTGKTIGSLAIARTFINMYNKIYQSIGFYKQTPYVYILGFSKRVFQNELISHPEFGLVSREEIEVMKRHEINYATSTEAEKKQYDLYKNKIKRRLGKKSSGGYYKFIGYREFFNLVFRGNTANLTTEEEIIAAIREKKITVNFEIIKSFANCCLICDEIHNLYNSIRLNSYGIAIKLLLDMYDNTSKWADIIPDYEKLREFTKDKELRAILLSATVATNKVAENIDILNLTVPVQYNGFNRDIVYSDIFTDNGDLHVAGRKYLETTLQGYVSFIRDDNPKYFPEKKWSGEKIKIPGSLLSMRAEGYNEKFIPYIYAKRCEYSKLHLNTVNSLDNMYALGIEGNIIYDMVFPNPESQTTGLYVSKDIHNKITYAPTEWKTKIGINEYVNSEGQPAYTGEFLKLANIGNYSGKYKQLIEDVIHNIKNKKGKSLIIHPYVQVSATNLIRDAFIQNGFIDDQTSVNENTICIKCGHTLKSHKNDHEFVPAKLMFLSGSMDKSLMYRKIDMEWNSSKNLYGDTYILAIGSRVVSEMYSFLATNNIFITGLPPDFSTLIQQFKRAYRKYAFINLPETMQYYNITLYSYRYPDPKKLSPDEYKLYVMSQDYYKIEQVDKIYNSVAIGSVIFRKKIMPVEEPPAELELGNVYFEPANYYKTIMKKPQELSTYTFYYEHETIDTIIHIIKRLFIEQSPAFLEKDLFKYIRNPPFNTEINTRELDDSVILKAIGRMTSNTPDMLIETNGNPEISALLDAQKMFVIIDDHQFVIRKYDDMYIRTPVLMQGSVKNDELGYFYSNRFILDKTTDSWLHSVSMFDKVKIIDKLLTVRRTYAELKQEFINRFKEVSISNIPLGLDEYNLEFHTQLLKDSIIYTFNILTIANQKISENHEFYFRMLNFYEKMEMVVFADMITENNNEDLKRFESIYSRYVNYQETLAQISSEDKELGRFLMTSVAKTQFGSQFNIDRLNKYIEGKDIRVIGEKKKEKILSAIKPGAFMVPVGCFVDNNTYSPALKLYIDFWNPDTESWEKVYNFIPNYIDGVKYTEEENSLMIGYQEKLPNSLNYKFKIRASVANISKTKDLRTLPRGNICNSHTKQQLEDIAAKLNITGITHIKDYCNAIRIELLRREIAEKRRLHKAWQKKQPYKKIRWFYQYFEKQPEIEKLATL